MLYTSTADDTATTLHGRGRAARLLCGEPVTRQGLRISALWVPTGSLRLGVTIQAAKTLA